MPMFKRLAFVLISLSVVSACAPGAREHRLRDRLQGAQSSLDMTDLAERHVRVAEATRTYWLGGAAQAASPAALVIALHGGGGNAATMAPRWLDLARREGFVVAFPEGVGRTERAGTWNAGGCCGHAMSTSSDDVRFIAALIDDASAARPIDRRRIYVTGLSNGGMLTYRAGIALSERLAGVAVVAGAMFGGEPQPRTSLPILIMHGERDEVVPFVGGPSLMGLVARAQSQPFLPVRDSVEFWRRVNQCEGGARRQTSGDVTVETFAECRGDGEVVFYDLASAPHAWPGPGGSTVAIERTPYTEIDASVVIWNFFEGHVRDE